MSVQDSTFLHLFKFPADREAAIPITVFVLSEAYFDSSLKSSRPARRVCLFVLWSRSQTLSRQKQTGPQNTNLTLGMRNTLLIQFPTLCP